MRIVARFVVTASCIVALVVIAGTAGGCGTAAGTAGPQWERVLSAKVSGEQPVKLNLGTHDLGDRVRLSWTLSGPKEPPVKLTLRAFSTEAGPGFSAVATPQSAPGGLARQDDNALSLIVTPGEYRIFFTQRFPQARGPGYDITLTIWTMHTYPPSP
ncbi:MAG TPA: hypothetical protein VFE45_03420, partial [Coriobacteriia bacterium]|nr:hypothetical protein [Coriobacteriia bacterium]